MQCKWPKHLRKKLEATPEDDKTSHGRGLEEHPSDVHVAEWSRDSTQNAKDILHWRKKNSKVHVEDSKFPKIQSVPEQNGKNSNTVGITITDFQLYYEP